MTEQLYPSESPEAGWSKDIEWTGEDLPEEQGQPTAGLQLQVYMKFRNTVT